MYENLGNLRTDYMGMVGPEFAKVMVLRELTAKYASVGTSNLANFVSQCMPVAKLGYEIDYSDEGTLSVWKKCVESKITAFLEAKAKAEADAKAKASGQKQVVTPLVQKSDNTLLYIGGAAAVLLLIFMMK